LSGLVLDVGRVDRDAALLLFGGLVDLVERHELRATGLREGLGDGRGQRGLAVVDVTDGADVDVGLVPDELFFGHVRDSLAYRGLAHCTTTKSSRRPDLNR
jgi:hypothetical protein